ncbi:hypothetical protein ABT336_11950 [Micromonospora sp. NPDC000207]|uniref:hypothetical protein n=1 Tax=Micromonospora sp. NPDC000207 TaxID=3154246 RepID=UPI0033222CA0
MTSATGDTTTHYHWEFQRSRDGLWAHHAADPRGTDRSHCTPEGFARQVLGVHTPDHQPWRLAVWDRPGVGAEPVYTITSDQARK